MIMASPIWSVVHQSFLRCRSDPSSFVTQAQREHSSYELNIRGLLVTVLREGMEYRQLQVEADADEIT
jgi:hypothetical protein